MAGATSLNLVREELEATIQNAESSLESFIEDRENSGHIQSCVDYLQQIRGTLSLIEMSGAELLAQEMVNLATDIPAGASQEKDETLSALGNALFVLNRYLEYLLLNKAELPELLIPTINDMREARHQPTLPESHFFAVRLDTPLDLQPKAEVTQDELLQSTRRLRHMYQIGLLGLFKNEQPYSSVGLMSRAVSRLYSLYGHLKVGKLLWVAAAALDGFSATQMQITKPRKLLFGKVDRQIKRLQGDSQETASLEPPKGLLKELLYLVALADTDTPKLVNVKKHYNIVALPFTDHSLAEERSILAGPGNAVYKSVSSAIKEELATIKDMLDLVERGAGQTDNDYTDMLASISKLEKTLIVVGLLSAARSLQAQYKVVEKWQAAGKLEDEKELLKLADAVLYVESMVSSLESNQVRSSERESATPGEESTTMANNQLAEAKIVVVGESQAGLAMAKRAITAYMESNWDKAHLGNLPTTLHAVRGGLYFMGLERAANILEACTNFIDQRIIHGNEPPTNEMLETLADALTGLEYFLEGVESTRQTASEVLEMAETSLADLGFPAKEVA
ncbi:hypothetical protein [Spartinivicinus poritis]|uniref:Scaffold protein FimL second domain-containing protein n=1 Tax=Spartinivicinus poritis TaxID=2994640 RepID=A0ABT5U3Y8_9GAMM|nr:hypothetical protein [Spartinivicinus sp. A2-2]MDE1461076.1 hypothetical protein [Spartinivicinus sp. A2-2]